MGDLTLLYITANQMPKHWMDFQIRTLLDVTAPLKCPIISVSRVPMNLGQNIPDDGPHGYWNIYRQMCRAAKLARTKYVAQCEDDTLYCNEHFREHRPADDAVAYNHSRWSLFAWDASVYCLRQRISNCSMIGPRDLVVSALEERLRMYPNGDSLPNKHIGEIGRWDIEKRLNLTAHKMDIWWSTTAIVQLNHRDGIDERQKEQRKSHGQLKAIEIPHWGRSDVLVRKYLDDSSMQSG